MNYSSYALAKPDSYRGRTIQPYLILEIGTSVVAPLSEPVDFLLSEVEIVEIVAVATDHAPKVKEFDPNR